MRIKIIIMKTKFTFITIALLLCIGVYAQAPEGINYQAIARDNSGNPLASTPVNIQFDIRQNTPTGTIVYSETHSLTTNQFGLFTAVIGNGNTSNNFSTIAWGAAPYYLEVTIDGNVMTATQLLSVPYALYAKESANGPTGAQGPPGIGINWLGTFSTAPATPSLNDAYYNQTLGQSFIWDGSAWQIIAQDGTVGSLTGGSGITIVGSTINNTGDLDSTNELQTLTYNQATQSLGITNGNNVTLDVNDADNDPNNEIELPLTGNTVGDVIKWNGTAWVNASDSVNDLDNDPNNEIELPATATTGDYLMWNGSSWVSNAISGDTDWIVQGINTYSLNDVAVGINNPSYQFHVHDSTGNATLITTTNSTTGSNISDGLAIGIDNLGNSLFANRESTETRIMTNNQTRILVSPTGDVSIGNNLPSNKLDVDGQIRMRGGAVNGYIPVSNPLGVMTWTDPSTISTASFWASTNTGTIHPTTLSDRVGIGTNAPLERLHVFETTNLDVLLESTTGIIDLVLDAAVNRADILFKRSGLLMGSIGYDLANSHLFLNDGVESLVSRSGNIGIGTSTPSSKLNVVANPNIELLELEGSGLTGGGLHFTYKSTTEGYEIRADDQGGINMEASGNHKISFETSGTERMRITGAGNVGIGTITPSFPLNVVAAGTTYEAARITNTAPITENHGLRAESSNATNANTGIWGLGTGGNFATGIYAYGSNGVNQSIGVDAKASGASLNYGVHADLAFATTGSSYAIFGNARGSGSANNTGVYGAASGATVNWAGYFASGNVYIQNDLGIGTTTPGTALEVVASSSINVTTDGYFNVGSNSGNHLTMDNNELQARSATGTNTLYLNYWGGDIAMASSATGAEVGIGTNSPNKKLHVVHAPTGTYDAAIYGSSSTTNNSGFFGAMAYDAGSTNYGVFAHSNPISNTSPLGVSRGADGALVDFISAGTVEGQIYVTGNTVVYGAFTGVHYGLTDVAIETGKLVTLTGKNENYHGNPNSEILYGVTESTQANDPKIMGTYLAIIDKGTEQSLDNPHQIMAVGNGAMWVVDNGKDIKPGDYLISSNTKGHAMLDKGDYDVSYIIARVSEPINWSEVTETIDGKKHKKITVFFESFVINHKANDLEKEIEKLKNNFEGIKVEIEELKKYSVVGVKN